MGPRGISLGTSRDVLWDAMGDCGISYVSLMANAAHFVACAIIVYPGKILSHDVRLIITWRSLAHTMFD